MWYLYDIPKYIKTFIFIIARLNKYTYNCRQIQMKWSLRKHDTNNIKNNLFYSNWLYDSATLPLKIKEL